MQELKNTNKKMKKSLNEYHQRCATQQKNKYYKQVLKISHIIFQNNHLINLINITNINYIHTYELNKLNNYKA